MNSGWPNDKSMSYQIKLSMALFTNIELKTMGYKTNSQAHLKSLILTICLILK
jgi:hypothetical protein